MGAHVFMPFDVAGLTVFCFRSPMNPSEWAPAAFETNTAIGSKNGYRSGWRPLVWRPDKKTGQMSTSAARPVPLFCNKGRLHEHLGDYPHLHAYPSSTSAGMSETWANGAQIQKLRRVAKTRMSHCTKPKCPLAGSDTFVNRMEAAGLSVALDTKSGVLVQQDGWVDEFCPQAWLELGEHLGRIPPEWLQLCCTETCPAVNRPMCMCTTQMKKNFRCGLPARCPPFALRVCVCAGGRACGRGVCV